MKTPKDIILFEKSELEAKKLSEITDQYNSLSKLIGLKAVKKFRDKPTAISRTLDAQETYREDLIEATKAAAKESKKTTKISKSSLDMDSVIELSIECSKIKPNTIEATISKSLSVSNKSVKELVKYIVSNHKRPRSLDSVDEQYAIHNIRWFLKKGHLKIVK